MVSLELRPPQFSEEVAWLPSWFQHLRTDGSDQSGGESQITYKQVIKNLGKSQENVGDGKDTIAQSSEDGYNSCHLFLSAEDNSPVRFAPSPGNVFHLNLHLSSDVDSFFCPTASLDASHDLVASREVLSEQPVETFADFRENVHSIMDCCASGQKLLPSCIPETVVKDSSKSQTDTVNSVRQHKEMSNSKSFRSSDISNAVELSIAASEALVIHDSVKTMSVSETIPTEAVLEIALRVKQARLEGLENGFHSSNEESDWSDSLSDLNDFSMEDAYEDVGLPYGVSNENHLCSSAIHQAEDVSGSENHFGCDNKNKDKQLTSQFINLDDNSAQKKLEACVEMEMQQKPNSPLVSLCCEKQMYSDDCGLGSNSPAHLENVPLKQTVDSAMVDVTLNKPKISANASLEKENWATYLFPDRFQSRWLGGWTCKDNEKQTSTPKFFIRETSFLSESADIVSDKNSFVQKHDSNCGISSQLSFHNKADEGISHSQDVVRCSNLSLVDVLCSVVPCSISCEHANFDTQTHKENNIEEFLSAIPVFDVDNFQSTSYQNVAPNSKDGQITPLLDGGDIPITVADMVEQIPEKLTSVEQTCRKGLNSLKTYSMIVPNQSLKLKCNLALVPTNQRMDGVASLDKRNSKGLSSKCAEPADGKNGENQKSVIEIGHEKRSDNIKVSDSGKIPVEPSLDRKSPLFLNHRTRRRFLGPKTILNDINVEKHLEQHIVPETFVQHQQNMNRHKLRVKCNTFHDGDVRVKKQVRFSEAEEQLHQKRTLSNLESYHNCSSTRVKRKKISKSLSNFVPHMKYSVTNYCRRVGTKLIFQGIEFLLTGLSSQKERDMEALIRNSGGVVLSDIPSPPTSRGKRKSILSRQQLPIILCTKKLQTAKFLYGCAIGASILKVDWLTDCIAAGTILQPEKYMILPNRSDLKWTRIGRPIHLSNQKHIFDRVGIMLHGKPSFCTKLARLIKHGGGQVFKTLHWLVRGTVEGRITVGAIVAENMNWASRHLKHCALEQDIPMMPSSWIIESLYAGNLLPFREKNLASPSPVNVPEVPTFVDRFEEI